MSKVKRPKIGRRVVKSDFEFQTYKVLKGLLPKGATLEYEVDEIAYVIERKYIPDLTITFNDGTIRYIECKGYFDAEDRQKQLLVKAQNPEADIRLVFMNNNKIHKHSTTRYSDWCTKHGFKFAFKEIPEEWLTP